MKHIMRTYIQKYTHLKKPQYLLWGVFSICIFVCGIAGGLYSEGHTYTAVEVGLAELSPRGIEGGYAAPASGESVPTGDTPTYVPNVPNPGTICGATAFTCPNNTLEKFNPDRPTVASTYIDVWKVANKTQTSTGVSWDCVLNESGITGVFGYATFLKLSTLPEDHCTLNKGVCGEALNTCLVGGMLDVEDPFGDVARWVCLGEGDQASATCERQLYPSCSTTVKQCDFGALYPGSFNITDNQYTWDCYIPNKKPENGLVIDNCSVDRVGKCGSEDDTCTFGTYLDAPDTIGKSNWTCSAPEQSAQCSVDINGKCGIQKNTCDAGEPLGGAEVFSTYSNSIKFTWQCVGRDSTASCSLDLYGKCAAEARTCYTGTPSNGSITSSGEYTWDCVGAYSTETCKTERPVCSTTKKNTCITGTFVDVADPSFTSITRWKCEHNSLSTICEMDKTAKCGVSEPLKDWRGNIIPGAMTNPINNCEDGTLVDTDDSVTDWLWSCVGATETVSCSYPKPEAISLSITLEGKSDQSQIAYTTNDFSIYQGESLTLRWERDIKFLTCTASFASLVGKTQGVYNRGVITNEPGSVLPFSITCVPEEGERVTEDINVTVIPRPPRPPEPLVVLMGKSTVSQPRYTQSNFSINEGESVDLLWGGENVYPDSCVANFVTLEGLLYSHDTTVPINGQTLGVTPPPPGESITYSFLCQSDSGPEFDNLTVTTIPAEADASPSTPYGSVPSTNVPDIEADPTTVNNGDPTTISYDTQSNDPASCTITGPSDFSYTPTTKTGTTTVYPTSKSTYKITCPGGIDSVVVSVNAILRER